MTLDPAELRAVAEATRDRARKEREAKERQERREYTQKKKAAMERVPHIINDLERAIEYQAREGRTRSVSTQHTGNANGKMYDDLVLAPLNAVVEHFLSAGFSAKIELEHTTEYYSDGAGPGPTHTKIVLDWSEHD